MVYSATRFAPTVTSGNLHIGHITNLLCNLFYAKQHNTNFYLILDNFNENNKFVKNNMELLKILLPGHRGICYNSNAHNMISALYYKFGAKISLSSLPKYDDHFYLTVLDHLLGVTRPIRGRDWKSECINNMSIYVLNSLNGFDPYVDQNYYHPIIKIDNNKISKSDQSKDISINRLINMDIHQLSMMYYIGLKLLMKDSGKWIVESKETILNFYKIFDLVIVCNDKNEDIDFNLDELVLFDKNLKRYISNPDDIYKEVVDVKFK